VPGKAAFYAPDFYLSDPDPWLIPEYTMPMSWDELSAHLARHTADPSFPRWSWTDPGYEQWKEVFAQIARRLQNSELRKAVPVVFERAQGELSEAALGSMLCKLGTLTQPVSVYGWWNFGEGMLGATPEVLFSMTEPGELRTMALAGTRPRQVEAQEWNDAKEQHEHQVVVDDIVSVLSGLGKVTVAPRRILPLALMEHWLTEIHLTFSDSPAFETLIRALHPTAALGVSPRSFGFEWLRTTENQATRGRFGAPFGIRWPDGRSHCLVAIRNIQWRNLEIHLGSGCGIVEGSRLEKEWEELSLKRRSVKGMLGI
jgi:menaquinone-specific isochorismate synthase